MSNAGKRALQNRMLKVEKDTENKSIKRKVTIAESALQKSKPRKQFGNPKKNDAARESVQETNKSTNRPMRLCEIMRTRNETAKKRDAVPSVHLVGPVHRNPLKNSPVRKSHLNNGKAGTLLRRNPSPIEFNVPTRTQPLVRAARFDAIRSLCSQKQPSADGMIMFGGRTLGKGAEKRKTEKKEKIRLQPIIIEELSTSSEWDSGAIGQLPLMEEPDRMMSFSDIRTDFESFSESPEEFLSAPPLSDRTTTTVESLDYSTDSAKIIKNFREVLASKKKTMKPEELDVIKSVIKADSRHRHLRRADPGMVKTILKSQLDDIMNKESVIVTALKELDTEEFDNVNKVTETTVSYFEDPKKSRVDVIFKNVRSREREIVVLKALTEEMEAKLQRMESPCSTDIETGRCLTPSKSYERVLHEMSYLHSALVETKTIGVVQSVGNMSTCVGTFTVMHRAWHEVSFQLGQVQNARVRVHPMGVLQDKGIVDEYLIAQKTLSQLKQESESRFYLPMNDKEADMLCTSYKKLQEDMYTLVRYLKPKSDLVPFNNLEDPTRLNNLIIDDQPNVSNYSSICVCKVYSDIDEPAALSRNESSEEVELRNAYIEYGMVLQEEKSAQSVRKVPDVFQWLEEDKDTRLGSSIQDVLEKQNEKGKEKSVKKIEMPSVHEDRKDKETGNKYTNSEDIVGPNVSKSVGVRDAYTTMPLEREDESKNALWKTVLVGTAQMFIFILFIMALSYPYPKCEHV